MLVDFVQTYWLGVLKRLQAEIDLMNGLVAHNGTKGTENEGSLLRIVENLIPTRFGVGTGLLIDSKGRSSRQMDLVIYDRGDEPALLAQTNQVLFPVESVRLCVEVKTTVDKREVDDARKKKASIQALHSTTGRHPPLGLFGYRSPSSSATISGHLLAAMTEDGPTPDAACLLSMALFAHPAGAVIGVAALQADDALGEKVLGSTQRPLDTENAAVSVIRSGESYPLVEVQGTYLIAEPSRALLLFCEWLLNALRDGDQKATLSEYLSPTARDLQSASSGVDT